MLHSRVWATFFVHCLFIVTISGGGVGGFGGSSNSVGSSELEEEHSVILEEGEEGTLACPDGCICTGTEVDCSDLKLWTVPLDIGLYTTILDLSQNHIQHLVDYSFARYHHLEELNLASNNLVNLSTNAFAGIGKLRVLNLRFNNLSSIPWHAFHDLHFLHELHLGDNQIQFIYKGDFYGLRMLKTLTLEGNGIQTVPSEALRVLTNLEMLSLTNNNISSIENGSFETLTNLKGLSLANNEINSVESKAFEGLASLEVLELQHNHLDVIPIAINSLISVQKIFLAFNHIRHVLNSIFAHNPMLIHVDILGNPVLMVEHNVFTNLTQLKILIIPEAKELTRFPDLNGTSSLGFLRIDRARIRHVPSDLCGISHHLKTLDLKSNFLVEVPPLNECTELRQLQLSGNEIRSLEGGLFEHQNLLHDLLLSNNVIESLPFDAFVGLHKLEILNLVGNQIASIHPDAFLPLKQLVYLNLAENRFPQLPNDGLQHVRQLLAFNNPFLRDFPPPSSFPHVHTLKLAYAYHCCQFSPSGRDVGGLSGVPGDIQETVLWLPKDKVDLSLWAGNSSDIWPAYQNLTHKFGDFAEDLWGSLSPDYVYPSNLPQVVEDYFEEGKSNDYHRPGHSITCSPQPGPFMPCEDLFDFWTLRCGIWIVFLLAMLGNGTVVFVLIFSRTKMDVPRFLVCNLACADFCMGVYLGFLAVVDASTLGQFKMHALQWQFSGACQLAGFLGVLSSELSVFTLAVITLERNYAITHAMHLNKRLSLKHAAYIMGCGWTFATVTAGLPLVGISDYRKFAICLPFDIEGPWALTYVVFLMAVNGVAFLILMGCYLKMYCAIRGSQAWNSNDSRIAKRMALLVFTDFICWAPIAFFSLTAAFGMQLVSLEEAKVFTIFVLPLNSCANPFLYAILTKQFKKDCVLICKAIEESRVTRGIGRCRHSSNFSNRQTPANTNSAVDRNSNNGQVACSCSRGSSDGVRIPPTQHGGVGGATSDAAFRRRRWRVFKMRVLFCVGGDSEPNLSSDYTYAIAEIQKNQQKHSRNLSVSSDNFSSSRSDSWRQKSIPLRLIEKGRRNSWTITRKPSQDSNLSSSRNDSSATTPSTSTWRVSRSSVSSDMSSGNMGQRTTTTNLRTPGGGVGVGASSSVQCPANCTAGGGVGSSNDGQSAPTVRFNLPKNCGAAADVDSETILLTSARPRAKLRRQSAVNEENFVSPSSRPTPLEDKFSCLYSRLSQVAREEDEENVDSRTNEVSGDGRGVGGGYSMSSADRLRYAASRHAAGRNLMDYGSRSGPTGFARGELFLPRKLSTISSNSCSLNQDTWSLTTGGQANSTSLTPSATLTRDRSSASDLERPSSMTNVAAEGPAFVNHRRTLSDASFYHRRPSVPIGLGRQSRGSDLCCKLSQSDYVIDAGCRPRWDGFPRTVLQSDDTKQLLSNYRHVVVDTEAVPRSEEEQRPSAPSSPPPYLEDDV